MLNTSFGSKNVSHRNQIFQIIQSMSQKSVNFFRKQTCTWFMRAQQIDNKIYLLKNASGVSPKHQAFSQRKHVEVRIRCESAKNGDNPLIYTHVKYSTIFRFRNSENVCANNRITYLSSQNFDLLTQRIRVYVTKGLFNWKSKWDKSSERQEKNESRSHHPRNFGRELSSFFK